MQIQELMGIKIWNFKKIDGTVHSNSETEHYHFLKLEFWNELKNWIMEIERVSEERIGELKKIEFHGEFVGMEIENFKAWKPHMALNCFCLYQAGEAALSTFTKLQPLQFDPLTFAFAASAVHGSSVFPSFWSNLDS